MTQIDISYSWIGSINLIKMTILSKAIYRFNTIPVKLPVASFTELEYNILTLVCIYQRLWKAKQSWERKSRARVLRLPVFKLLLYKATIIKNLWPWHKIWYTDQWDRTESPEINPCTDGQNTKMEALLYNVERLSLP